MLGKHHSFESLSALMEGNPDCHNELSPDREDPEDLINPSEDHVLYVSSGDIAEEHRVISLTHYNVVSAWVQLRYRAEACGHQSPQSDR